MKNYTIARKIDDIYTVASQAIRDYTELRDHPHGRITVSQVKMDHDYDYLDVMVTAEAGESDLPHFLAPLAPTIRTSIGERIPMRKLPKIRFRSIKKEEDASNVLTILSELGKKYDLTK